ncbi:MAG TPA: M3 family metallopeptidase [Usitatibacter sp.]|nr:M3 family metallopeptidase [Usitatibacter sp.]
MSRAFYGALLAVSLPVCAAAPEATPMPLYDAAGVERACAEGLDRARKSMAEMEAKAGPAGILDEWNRHFIIVDDASNVVSLYGMIHPDKAVRAAAEGCEQKFNSVNTELNQSEKIFARLKAYRPKGPVEAKLKRDLSNIFEDSGAALPPDKRARAKAILDELEVERIAFERNVRDDPTKVVFTPAEMDGLPEAYLKARKRDDAGNYVLGLDQPSYTPFMQNVRSEAARERYFRARFQQGGVKNLEHMERLFKLRQELASLYGLPTFADYAVRRKMAAKPENVVKFLGEVKAAIAPAQERELAELRKAKAEENGTPLESTRLRPWDQAYYTEKLRRARFDVDQEKLRAYFPADKSLDYALLLAERLYGLKFRESKVPTWHDDVRYFDIHDARSGAYLANLYVDLFPREGKRPGAFAGAVRTPSKRVGRRATTVLVANFNRVGLNQREIETLLHELGHALNASLSYVDYAPQGLSTIKWDFVEAPSQMFEEWARRKQSLALFKEVCPQCPQLSEDEIRRLEEARRFGEASGYAYQWLLATFDMEMSMRPRAPLEVWKALESATPLGHVEGTMFPTGFRHLASGYAAGYYGYMWSRVIARDLLSAFKDDLLDPRVGARYRESILGAGSQVEEAEMVRKFLGRDASSAPFFKEISGG